MDTPVYLDNNATTRVDPRVLEAMLPYFSEDYGNASSKTHPYGWKAEKAVEYSKKSMLAALNTPDDDIIFTSGATESINMAHIGIAQGYYSEGTHIITSNIEHSASLDSLKYLEKKGFTVTYLPVNDEGLITPQQVEEAITDKTILVSLMAANNEIGTLFDIQSIGDICGSRGILFHTDASQAAGKINFDLSVIKADLVSFTAHKIYGPKGIGALYIRKKPQRINIVPLFAGGSQQGNLRPGTLNVPGIVGFAHALKLAAELLDEENGRIKELRDLLLSLITSALEGTKVNGSLHHRLSNNLNVSFKDVSSANLLLELKELAFSTGSACASASPKPSRVLKALGLTDDEAFSSVRIGVGRFNTREQIEFAAGKIIQAVNKLRAASPAAVLGTITEGNRL